MRNDVKAFLRREMQRRPCSEYLVYLERLFLWLKVSVNWQRSLKRDSRNG